MSYSQTTSLVCAALAGIVILIVIILQIRQRILKGRGLLAPEPEEDHEPAKTAPARASAPVPTIIPAPQTLPAAAAVAAEPAPEEEGDDEPVTSLEIVTFLKGLPTVEAELAKEKFKGAEVEWTLYYSSTMLKGSDQIEIMLLNADNAYPGVSFLVGLNQYPELRTVKWGQPITVNGTISSVYAMYIILTDVTLSFPPAADPA